MRETYLIQTLFLEFVEKFVLRQKFVRNIFGKTWLPEIMFTQDLFLRPNWCLWCLMCDVMSRALPVFSSQFHFVFLSFFVSFKLGFHCELAWNKVNNIRGWFFIWRYFTMRTCSTHVISSSIKLTPFFSRNNVNYISKLFDIFSSCYFMK